MFTLQACLQAHFPGFIYLLFNSVCTNLSICLLSLSLSFFIWASLYSGKLDVYVLVKNVLYWNINNANKKTLSVYFKVKYISIQAASLPNKTSGKSNWLDKLLLDGYGLISKDKCFFVNCLDHMPTGDCIQRTTPVFKEFLKMLSSLKSPRADKRFKINTLIQTE